MEREDHELLSSNQKDALARNYDKLGSNMKLETLLPKLVREKVIRIADKPSILSQKTPQQQNEKLIDNYIDKGSKGTFRKFVHCLVDDGQLPIAILLDPNARELIGSPDTVHHPSNSSASSSAPASTSVLHLTGLSVGTQELIHMDVLQGEQKMVKRNVTKLPPGVHICYGTVKVQVDECYYYFGGYTKDSQGKEIAHDNAYKYNGKSKQWITLNSLPAARRDTAACNIGNVIIIVGGVDEDNHLRASIWAYNMSDDSYTALNDIPARLNAPAAAVFEGIAYVSGGHEGYKTNITSKVIYQYKKKKNVWKQVGSLLHERFLHGMFEYDGSLYNIGGRRGKETTPVLSIERFDPRSDQSTRLSSTLPYKMLGNGWVRHGRYVYFAVFETNYLYCFDITSDKIMQCGEEKAVFTYLMLT